MSQGQNWYKKDFRVTMISVVMIACYLRGVYIMYTYLMLSLLNLVSSSQVSVCGEGDVKCWGWNLDRVHAKPGLCSQTKSKILCSSESKCRCEKEEQETKDLLCLNLKYWYQLFSAKGACEEWQTYCFSGQNLVLDTVSLWKVPELPEHDEFQLLEKIQDHHWNPPTG